VFEDKYQVGQGLVTYGKRLVQNWLATMVDWVRVGTDLGDIRFALNYFNRPVFSFKGKFY
jgi:hypothetical protein